LLKGYFPAQWNGKSHRSFSYWSQENLLTS
jgi:hypothetical protein